MEKLSAKEKVFVSEYLIDLNAAGAFVRAGYKAKNIKVASSGSARLMAKDSIKAAIKAEMDKRAQRTQVTMDRVLQEYACLAFFDIGRIVNASGEPLKLSDMDEDTRRAIVGVDLVTISCGPEGTPPGQVMKVKMADKKGALDSCARHLGMFEKDNAQASGADALTTFLQQLCNGSEKLKLPSQDAKAE